MTITSTLTRIEAHLATLRALLRKGPRLGAKPQPKGHIKTKAKK
jgi:hypothetical protein